MPSRPKRKPSKKTKTKARAQAPKSARKNKRSGKAARSSPRLRVKSRKPAPKRRLKRPVARKRSAVSALSKRQRQGTKRESNKMDTVYHMTVEEIEVIPSPENHLQTDLWEPETPKP